MADSDLRQKREGLKAYYKSNGSGNMTDCELLEAVLTMSLCMKDANETANALMSEYGSLKNILFLPPNQLLKTDNIDLNTAIYLSILKHIKAKSEFDKNERLRKFSDTESIIGFAQNMLSIQTVERVILVTLDADRQIINSGFISKGNTNSASVIPNDISRRIIDEKPKFAFVAHNHLTDSCFASFSDINFTINLLNWLNQFGIELIDHIIVSKNSTVSMAQDDNYSFIFSRNK